MNSNIEGSSSKGRPSGLLLCTIFLFLLASRRWEQLVSPQVWCEDAWLIEGFMKNGWHELLLPLNGYLVLVPKIITGVSMDLSVYYYPLVSTILTWVLTALVGLAVAFGPIRLRGKVLCAISIFAIPSDPEVFGLPLYTLWWSAILLLVCALWDERVPARFIRSGFVIAGGLSSPFIFVALPVLCFRAFWYRTFHAERIVALVGMIIAAIQIPFVFPGAARTVPPISSIWRNVIPKFCGWFVLGNFAQGRFLLWAAGFALVALMAMFLFSRRRDPSAWILFGLYVGAVCSSITRVDPSILIPAQAGPRYFFLPYVLTYWILIQLCLSANANWIRLLAAITASIALLNAIPVWTRHHYDMRWAENVRSSRLFPEYWIKAQYDGSSNSGFFIKSSGATWDALLQRDRFVSASDLQNLSTFAYRVVDRSESDKGSNLSIPSSHIRVGSHEALLRLRTGDRVRFRSGGVARCQNMEVIGHEGKFISSLPVTADWVTLEFSNSRLPSEFDVRIVDQGQGVGEWSPTSN